MPGRLVRRVAEIVCGAKVQQVGEDLDQAERGEGREGAGARESGERAWLRDRKEERDEQPEEHTHNDDEADDRRPQTIGAPRPQRVQGQKQVDVGEELFRYGKPLPARQEGHGDDCGDGGRPAPAERDAAAQHQHPGDARPRVYGLTKDADDAGQNEADGRTHREDERGHRVSAVAAARWRLANPRNAEWVVCHASRASGSVSRGIHKR